MGTRSIRPSVAIGIVTVMVTMGVACGDGGDGVVAETRRSTEAPLAEPTDPSTSSTERGLPSVTWATSSSLVTSHDPQVCASTTAPDGTAVTVVVVAGSVPCDDAEAVVARYHRTGPTVVDDLARPFEVDGWECMTDREVDPGPVVMCVLPGVVTVVAGPDVDQFLS